MKEPKRRNDNHEQFRVSFYYYDDDMVIIIIIIIIINISQVYYSLISHQYWFHIHVCI